MAVTLGSKAVRWAAVILAALAPASQQNAAHAAEVHVIPNDRLIKWRPGVEGGVPDVPTVVDLRDYGPAADGTTDDGPVFQRALADVEPPGALYVPAGTYLLKSVLRLRSGVVLRGAGSDRTHLIFDAPDFRWRGAVEMKGAMAPAEQTRAIERGADAGSRTLTLDSTEGIEAGQTVLVCMDNDPDLHYTRPEWDTTWSRDCVGQLVRIDGVDGQTVRLDVPLRLTYAPELHPRLRPLRPIERAGLEGVHIKRLDHAEGTNVAISEAVNCWVRDCELDYCYCAHVSGSRARFVTVEGCYIHHAWNYGGGGHGYGVNLGRAVSDWLVTNNVFRHLRHSMLVQVGANGNVFSYNYSFEHQMCDISVHGHYAYMNLFEGNVLQWAVVGDWWGPAGPLNTLFRNRIVAEPPEWAGAVRVADHSHRTTVVGNTIPNGPVQITDDTGDCLIGANLMRDGLAWGHVEQGAELPASLYLTGKPDFWDAKPWPGIGADVDAAAQTALPNIPAQDRAAKLPE